MTQPAPTVAGDPVAPVVTPPTGRTIPARAWTIAFLVASAGTIALLVWLGRTSTFWADAWKFVDERLPWTVDAFLAPHWEHPAVLMVVLWKALFESVGLGSYAPYLLLLGVAHVLVAGAVFTIVRRSAGDPAGFAAGLLMLLLGTSGEALLLATAFGHVAAAAAGCWALVLFLGRPSRWSDLGVAVLLLVSIAFTGSGLVFIAAIGATALVVGRWRGVLLTVPALAAYLAWQLAYGSGGVAGHAADSIAALPDYVAQGIGHAAGAVSSLGDSIGLVLAVLLVVATAWHLFGRRPVMLGAVAGVAGLLAVYGVTGLARATAAAPDGGTTAVAGRYVYLAAPFLLIAVGAWLTRRPGLSVREPRHLFPALALLGAALAGNAWQLHVWGDFVSEQGDEVRAAITVLTTYGGSTALPADRTATPPAGSYLTTVPSPDRLREIIARYGRPGGDTPVRPEVLERVLLGYVGPWFTPSPLTTLPPGLRAPDTGATTDLVVATGPDGCLALTPSGPAPTAVVTVPGDRSLVLAADAPSSVTASLSADGSFGGGVDRAVSLAPGEPMVLPLPDLAAAWPWQVRLSLTGTDPISVCSGGD